MIIVPLPSVLDWYKPTVQPPLSIVPRLIATGLAGRGGVPEQLFGSVAIATAHRQPTAVAAGFRMEDEIVAVAPADGACKVPGLVLRILVLAS